MNAVPQRKIRRRRLSEELTTQLRKHIIEHGLKPGDPLLTEQEMVERFGVSRSVVREATKALDFLGIIDAVPRRGMILDQFDFTRVSEYFGFHFALSDYPKEKLLRARAVIETGALYYVVKAMQKDPRVHERLQALAEAAPDTDQAGDRWIEYDIAFHHGLVVATDITPLASFCDLLQAFFQKFRAAVMSNVRAGRQSHCEIVAALHSGQLEKATVLLRHHLSCYEQEQALSTSSGES